MVVCTYNRAKFLPDCLQSLASQSAGYAAYEVVLVNNNSTDDTEAIALAFGEENPGLDFTCVVEPRQGLSFARNRGIALSKYPLITYIDDDAVASRTFVESIIAFFLKHPDACAAGGKVLARFEGMRPAWFNPYSASLFFSHYDPGDKLFRYRGKGYPIGCNMSFQAAWLRGSGGFDTGLGRKGKGGVGAEEKALFQQLQKEGCPVYFDPGQVVEHQIDRERTRAPYTRRLALGLGQTHRKMYCAEGLSLACLRVFLVSLAKLAASAGLALGYLLSGRTSIATHLVWYRWMVLKGFFMESPN